MALVACGLGRAVLPRCCVCLGRWAPLLMLAWLRTIAPFAPGGVLAALCVAGLVLLGRVLGCRLLALA